MNKSKEAGFGILPVMLVVLVVVIVGLVGLIVFRGQDKPKTTITSVNNTGDPNLCLQSCAEAELNSLVSLIKQGIKDKDLTADPSLTTGLPKSVTANGETVDTRGKAIYVDMATGAFCVSSPFGKGYNSVTGKEQEIFKTAKRCKSATDIPV